MFNSCLIPPLRSPSPRDTVAKHIRAVERSARDAKAELVHEVRRRCRICGVQVLAESIIFRNHLRHRHHVGMKKYKELEKSGKEGGEGSPRGRQSSGPKTKSTSMGEMPGQVKADK